MRPPMPRILFVNSNTQDYLADGVFHGLRSLLGADAIDFPQADYLYETFPADERDRLWGRGFTLYGRLPDIPVPRHHALWRAIDGEFDLVVFGDIWRSFGLWTEWGVRLEAAGVPMAVLDGHDAFKPYPYSWFWWRVPRWWLLPRAHTRAAYFKREITPRTRWFASYLLLPPRLGRTLDMRPISLSIPADKVLAAPPAKDKDFPVHVVDAEVASGVGAGTGHAFATESDYYADLQRSRFGITAKRAGWDALRHYEIAANGAVPCFRELDRKPPMCAPFGLNATNCICYRDAGDLLHQVAALDDARYAQLQANALEWARANTTVVRARYLLAACGVAS
jgi:hypothetical protein